MFHDAAVLAEISPAVAKPVLAAALGLFLGLEREWSNRSAGVRTFALVALAAAVFVQLGEPLLLAVGGLLVVVHGILLGVSGLELVADAPAADSDGSLSLTTSASLLIAYGVGALVGQGHTLSAVTVAVLSSLLLILRRELHDFAHQLTREEVRGAAELAILAFVVYPVLPTEPMGPWEAIQPRMVWLLVVLVSGIGFLNYALMTHYGGHGIAVTSFFGGLVNSTAVVGELATRVAGVDDLRSVVPAAILLTDAAMALRNLSLVLIFIPAAAIDIGVPLGAIALGGVLYGYHAGDWAGDFDIDLDSPFRLSAALKFGALFLVVLVVAAGANAVFGAAGIVATAFISGFVSSGSATTTVVTLYSTGAVSAPVASAAIVAGTIASILVKIPLAGSVDRSLIRPVAVASAGLVLVGTVATGGLLLV
jgi:uncharacterized membrane protein (DUF4010 family)